MSIAGGCQAFTNEVAKMSESNEKNITNIRGDEDIVWRVLLYNDMRVTRTCMGVIAVVLIGAVSKLSVNSRVNRL